MAPAPAQPAESPPWVSQPEPAAPAYEEPAFEAPAPQATPPPPPPTWEWSAAAPGASSPTGSPDDEPVGPERNGRRGLLLVLAAVLALGLAAVAAVALAGSFGSSGDDASGQRDGGSDVAGDVEGDVTSGAGAAGPLQPTAVEASCQAPPGVDSVGNTITYEPQLVLDGLPATAWRCPGPAFGQQLVFEFDAPVTVTSVALIPGYAKVDPADGTDRFLENRTITAVRWSFDDGRTEDQVVASPSPSLAVLEIPGGVTTQRVVLGIAGTGNDAAIRDFTAISDVRFTGS